MSKVERSTIHHGLTQLLQRFWGLLLIALFFTAGLLLNNLYAADSGFGQPAPLFSIEDLEGKTVSASSIYESGPTLLIFESITCIWCRKEMPHLEALNTLYQGRLNVVTIVIDPEIKAIREYVSSQNSKRLWLWDRYGDAQTFFRSSSTPNHYLIDREGFLVGSKVGYLTPDELEAFVAPVI